MKIGIDARLINETGVGRYLQNLISELGRVDKQNQYIIYLRSIDYHSFVVPNSRWEKRLAEVRWHTLQEQLIMPGLFRSDALDLVHIPYHNPPILYGGKMVMTIHDLTILHFATGKATTLPFGLYAIKRLGYRLGLWMALRRARGIIAVSETTKQEIIDHFQVNPAAITVTYEGVTSIPATETEPIVSVPYVLYVGNAYPHKNLETLLRAFQAHTCTLVLVGSDDFFYRRLKRLAGELNIAQSVIFFGPANDQELANLYTHARALVFPSLMEGFGLPALEALSLGCPVIASNIAIFHEILRDHAVYFNPHDPKDLAAKLTEVVNRTDTDKMAQQRSGRAYAKKFSWNRMAKETLRVYENSTRL